MASGSRAAHNGSRDRAKRRGIPPLNAARRARAARAFERAGESALRRGDAALAARACAAALRLDRRHAPAWLLWGRLLERDGRSERALRAYRKAIRSSRGLEACLRVGEFCVERGWRAQAEALLRRAARLAPAGAASAALGEFLRAQGRFPDAARAFAAGRRAAAARFGRRRAQAAEFDFLLGRLHAQAGRRTPSARAFRRFLASDGPRPDCSVRRFMAHAALDQFGPAFAEAERILDRGGTCERERLFRPWSDHWLQPLPPGFYARRLRALEAAARALAPSPWLEFYRGQLLCRELGRIADGLARLDALRAFPSRRYGWMRHAAGVERLRLGDYDGAVVDLTVALAAMPDALWTRGFLAEARLCRVEREEAFKEFDRATEHPEPALRAGAWAWRGEALLWLGRYDEAVGSLDRAVSGGNWEALCWRGAARFLRGEREAARADLDAALGPGSRDAEALVWRGELARVTRDYALARGDLDRAVRLGAGPWAFANRALLKAAEGDREGARADFQLFAPEYAAFAARRLGVSARRGDFVALLEAALESARGIRRADRYLDPIWMGPAAACAPLGRRP